MKFNKYFDSYDVNAVVQKKVATKLLELSNKYIIYDSKNSVFEIGCGTGILTRKFLELNSVERLILNDYYDTRKYFQDVKYDRFVVGDIEKVEIEKVKVIVSSSVFQWIKNFDVLVEKISKKTEYFIFSMYLKGNLEEIYNHFEVSLEYLTGDRVIEILSKKFDILYSEEEKIRLDFDTPLLALRHLQGTGVGLEGKSSIKKIKSYRENSLTYNVGYFICKKSNIKNI